MVTPIDLFPFSKQHPESPSADKQKPFHWTITKDTLEELISAINYFRNRPSDEKIYHLLNDCWISWKWPWNLAGVFDYIHNNYDRTPSEKLMLSFFKALKKSQKNSWFNKLSSDEIEVITEKMIELNYKQTTINDFREMFLPESNPM